MYSNQRQLRQKEWREKAFELMASEGLSAALDAMTGY